MPLRNTKGPRPVSQISADDSQRQKIQAKTDFIGVTARGRHYKRYLPKRDCVGTIDVGPSISCEIQILSMYCVSPETVKHRLYDIELEAAPTIRLLCAIYS